MDYKNKTVLITGASSGIGEALLYNFISKSAKAIICGRNLKELMRVKNACSQPNNVEILVLDIADYHSTAQTIQKFLGKNRTIDILINNAGLSQRSLALKTDLQVDAKLIETNLLGTIAVTKAILPFMLKNSESHIVVVSSIMGKFGAPLRSSYAAAKHGLHGFFDTLRAELKSENIKILLVCPGFVRTNISKNALIADGSHQGTMDAATEKGFTPEHVAQKIIRAIENNKAEIVIAGVREKLAVYLKRFAPSLLRRMVQNAKTT